MTFYNHGSIRRVENGEVVSLYRFQHNPTTFTRTRKTKWVQLEAPGVTGSQVEFVSVGEWSITIDFFLSSWSVNTIYSRNGVRGDIAEMESWGLPSLDLFMADDSHYISPPMLTFVWGKRSWNCHCTSIAVKEEEWNHRLDPVRATVSVTLQTQTDSFASLQSLMAETLRSRAEVDSGAP